MNADVKAQWVDALRSGHYKQGKYQLREQGDFFDASGVLCDLAEAAGIIPAPRFTPKRDDDAERSWSGYAYGEPKEAGATMLPKAVQDWADVSYRFGYKVSLMGDKGKKFAEIADWIEDNL